jgi:hypothetical protein
MHIQVNNIYVLVKALLEDDRMAAETCNWYPITGDID